MCQGDPVPSWIQASLLPAQPSPSLLAGHKSLSHCLIMGCRLFGHIVFTICLSVCSTAGSMLCCPHCLAVVILGTGDSRRLPITPELTLQGSPMLISVISSASGSPSTEVGQEKASSACMRALIPPQLTRQEKVLHS